MARATVIPAGSYMRKPSLGAKGQRLNFTRAIVRKPGLEFLCAITASNLGRPDFETALDQHAAYCDALKECGLELTVLEADPRFPDGPFVEDTAVVTERCAIITNMSSPSRQGEQAAVQEALAQFKPIERISPPGTLDGGDVMRIGEHFYIGLSGRTNADGAGQLTDVLARHGYTASTVPVAGCLHLKTGVTWVGGNHVVARADFAGRPELAAFNVIQVAAGEDHAANCLLINGRLLMPAGCQATGRLLGRLSWPVIELPISEFQKMDGGLTCLSVRF